MTLVCSMKFFKFTYNYLIFKYLDVDFPTAYCKLHFTAYLLNSPQL
jgi:hypothetical protein